MPRIRNAVLAATVLAVGASLAFREGAFYQRAAGVEPLSGKSRMRREAEVVPEQRDESVSRHAEQRRQKVEAYLNKNGRTALNLAVAMHFVFDGSYLQQLQQEFDALEAEPISIRFAETALNPNTAEELMALEPDNAAHVLFLVEASSAGHPMEWTIEHLIRASGLGRLQSLGKVIEEENYEATIAITEDISWAWLRSNSMRDVISQSGLFERQGMDEEFIAWFSNGEVPAEKKNELAVAIHHLAIHAFGVGEEYTAAQWWKFLGQVLPSEKFPAVLGKSKAEHNADIQKMEERFLWQSRLFQEAISTATEDDFARLDAIRREKGMRASKEDYWKRIDIAELKRKAQAGGVKW